MRKTAMRTSGFGFAGEMSSGKGTATQLFNTWYPGTPSFRFSDSLRDFYRLLLENFPQLQQGAPLKLFEDNVPARMIGILESSFGSDLGATGARHIHFQQFLTWLCWSFIPAHSGIWPALASTRDLQAISTAVRKFFGEQTLELAIHARIAKRDSGESYFVIEGIRRLVDISTFRNNPTVPFCLIYVEADERIRFERHRLRNEKPGDSELSFAQFLELGKAEAEEQIRLLRPVADVIIRNNGTPKSFECRLRKVLRRQMVQMSRVN